MIFIRIPITWKSEVGHRIELSPKMRKGPNSSKDIHFSSFETIMIYCSDIGSTERNSSSALKTHIFQENVM